MDKNWLAAFDGQHVTVVTLAGSEERSDIGTLVRIADGWLQLVKDNGDMILVPSTAVRLVKLLQMTQRTAGLEAPGDRIVPARAYGIDEPISRDQAPDERAPL